MDSTSPPGTSRDVKCDVTYLIQGLVGHIDAVDLEHLVIDAQQSGGLRESSGD